MGAQCPPVVVLEEREGQLFIRFSKKLIEVFGIKTWMRGLCYLPFLIRNQVG